MPRLKVNRQQQKLLFSVDGDEEAVVIRLVVSMCFRGGREASPLL